MKKQNKITTNTLITYQGNTTNFHISGPIGASGASDMGITGTTDMNDYYYYKIKSKFNNQTYETTRVIQIRDVDVHMFFAVEKQEEFISWQCPKEQMDKMKKLKFNAKLKKLKSLDAKTEEIPSAD